MLGGEETWRDADSTAGQSHFSFRTSEVGIMTNPWPIVACDKCGHPRAYFYQLQIRSADEPMTTCAFSTPPLGLDSRNLGTDLLLGISLQVSFTSQFIHNIARLTMLQMRRMCLLMA